MALHSINPLQSVLSKSSKILLEMGMGGHVLCNDYCLLSLIQDQGELTKDSQH